MKMSIHLITFVILVKCICATKNEICQKIDDNDHSVENYSLTNSIPVGLSNKTALIIDEIESVDMDDCVKLCCREQKCDGIIVKNKQCSFIHCPNIVNCKPIILKRSQSDQYYIPLKFFRVENASNMIAETKKVDESFSTCEISVPDSCFENQYCKQIIEDRRTGVCVCNNGYIRKEDECIKDLESEPKKETKIISDRNEMTTNSYKTFMLSTKLSTAAARAFYDNKTTPLFQEQLIPKLFSKKPVNVEKPSASEYNKTKINKKDNLNMTKGYQLKVNAGPNVTMKILKSTLFDNPQIITLHGTVLIKNPLVNKNKLSFLWKRLPGSLATGKILNNSQKKQDLLLINLLEGEYLFQLTVTTEDGGTGKNSVKLNVIEIDDDISLNLMDIVLETNPYLFTENEKNNFAKKMGQIIDSELHFSQSVVEIHSVSPNFDNNTHITFYAKRHNPRSNTFDFISSGLLETKLRNKIIESKIMFNSPVKKFQSQKCYNDCSGHGICDKLSHRCHCFFPWFNNKYHENKTGFSNCDMHILLIIVSCTIGFFLFVILMMILRKIVNRIRLNRKYGKKVLQYRLLDDTDS